MADVRVLIDAKTKKKFKTKCAARGTTMSDVVKEAIEKYIK